MNRTNYLLRNESIKDNAISFIRQLPTDDKSPLEVLIQERKRTKDQNAKLWPMLTDVSEQVVWHGSTLTPEEWKHVFTAALHRQKVVPGIDGGFVAIGLSTSKMRVGELRDLIELIYAFGAEHGVKWSDEAKRIKEWAGRFGDGR